MTFNAILYAHAESSYDISDTWKCFESASSIIHLPIFSCFVRASSSIIRFLAADDFGFEKCWAYCFEYD